MDKWNCSHCGEELLGAVNRCWKCGQRVIPPPPTPPVSDFLVAEIATAGPVVTVDASMVQALVSAPPQLVTLTLDEVAFAMAKDPPRRGSPFAVEATLVDRKPHETYYGAGPYRQVEPISRGGRLKPRPAQYPRNTSAVGGITAALVLGILGLVFLYFSVLGGVTAAIGLGCAIWGLYDPRRKRLALVALLLCCLVLTIAAWMLGFQVYNALQQPVSPVTAGP